QAGVPVLKSDPVGFFAEVRPKNASTIWDINQYEWQDADWMTTRATRNSADAPMSVYELHLGSWQRKGDNEWLTYDDLIERLIPYILKMGFTHIELLPIMEHPFDGSWGYQVVGFFAPTSRFGTPDDFMRFVDACHQAGIGVLLDWVPAHFPKDQHGLGVFDGTHLYEHADPRQGEHPDWGTYVFNYDRNEVRQFLISNALFWLDKYHIDGLRVDAVASMLYLDFSRKEGQWIPNVHGGRENIGAQLFLRQFNEQLHEHFPDTVTIAEESTDWAGTTKPISEGGLGFDMKWNMGWMHDSIQYMSTDPIFRPYHHGTLTFSLLYAFSEKFMLPFSHDEVVHLKKSMLDKMAGDGWQMFANLRTLYGYMWAHPGKKLLFMGNEFAHGREWNEAYSLDWHLVEPESLHEQMSDWVRDLNAFYRANAAMWADDHSWGGFEWLEVHDGAHSVLAFQRKSDTDDEFVVAIFNFTPVPRKSYRLGVPASGSYRELLNSDDAKYGGSGITNDALLKAEDKAWRGQPCSIQLTLPPLGAVYLKLEETVIREP
ncbi:MAG: 1,4-alpha-glucan branching protein GlgB, partial [Candidatus Promineifilaceae bacterium]